jgi:hypothetical protein
VLVPRQRVLVLASLLLSAVLIGVIARSSPQPVSPIAVTRHDATFDGVRAIQYAGVLAVEYQDRVTGSEGARRAAKFLRAQFEALGYAVEDQPFTMWLAGQRVRGNNVIAVLPGARAENIAVIAHYDGQKTSPQSAEDNASGVGVLLELARELRPLSRARGLIFVATDAEEWGMIGARELAGYLKAHRTQAVISIDYLTRGAAPGLEVDSAGQFAGYAPLWLRTVMAESGRAQGAAISQPAGMDEALGRAVGISSQDQGPLNRAGIPSVNISTMSNDYAAVRLRYHTPQDVFRDFDPPSFQMLGNTVLQALAVLDELPTQREGGASAVLLAGDRFLPGNAILAMQLLGILPLCVAAWLVAGNLAGAHVRGLRRRLLTPLLWTAPPLAATLLLYGLTAAGILQRYELYPATPKDPFLYRIPLAVVGPLIAVLAAGLFAVRRLAARGASPGADFATQKSILFLWTPALILCAMLLNAYAACLFLAALGYAALLLVQPRRWFHRVANLALLLAAAAPFLELLHSVGSLIFLGPRILWYLTLQTAYGVWSPYAIVLFFLAVVVACQLARLSVLAPRAK